MSGWCVYRAYSPEGELLYIGHTGDIQARLRQHRRDRPWWHEVEYLFPQPCASKEEAVEAERLAICTERPKYNVQLSGPKMTMVNLRVRPEVKRAAMERAKREGTTLSGVLRNFYTAWAKGER